jgi:hypothetical protein
MENLTKAKQEQRKRDASLFEDYQGLKQKGIPSTVATEQMKKKYNLFSDSGIYKIIKREEARRGSTQA